MNSRLSATQERCQGGLYPDCDLHLLPSLLCLAALASQSQMGTHPVWKPSSCAGVCVGPSQELGSYRTSWATNLSSR